MIVIGLTGSIGMGKSTTAGLFRQFGAPVYDADAAVHRLYDGPGAAVVGGLFPQALRDGRIDRARLSELVIDHPANMRALENAVHPLLRAERADFLRENQAIGVAACVLDIPLLFETKSEREVDVIAVVTAPAPEQERRVLERKGWSRQKFEAIRAQQLPDAEKRRRAHYVIETGHGIACARRQVEALLRAFSA